MTQRLVWAMVVATLGCGGAAQSPPAHAPTGTSTSTPTVAVASDPFARPAALEPDRIPADPGAPPDLAPWKQAKTLKGLPARPASCKIAKESSKGPACADEASAIAAVQSALGATDRDAALAALAGCALPPGFVAAVRAEMLPLECADAVTDPWIDKGLTDVSPALAHILVGQSLGAKLARSVTAPPSPPKLATKEAMRNWTAQKVAPWALAQATLVQQLSNAGAGLVGVGLAIAAVEAGRADLRFVEVARAIPMPKEIRSDAELREIYESALEQALESRKVRGRDATLVALRTFADFGVIGDSKRMQSARDLLGTMYGGRRVDALDALIVPGAPPSSSSSELPSYLRALVPGLRATLIAEADRGAANALVPDARKTKPTEPTAQLARAQSSLRLAATHWRRASADAVFELLGDRRDAEVEPLLALALALHEGPKDVVQMMAASSPAALGFRNLAALDVVAKRDGVVGGAALFNATLLREVARPDDAGAAFYRELAAQYQAAVEKLGATPEGQRAKERATAALATAQAASNTK